MKTSDKEAIKHSKQFLYLFCPNTLWTANHGQR